MVERGEIALLEPWRALSTERRAQVEAEVAREVPQGHVLSGRAVVAVAARSDQDDVLFDVKALGYAVVHLSWSGRREESSDRPRTALFVSLDDWRERGMRADHEEYSA